MDIDLTENIDRDVMKEKLSKMSFEDLQKLKDKIGQKVYDESIMGIKKRKRQENAEFKRANKNRPREMSSKRPRPIQNDNIPTKKTVVRDPRFDPLCGTFDEKLFNKHYKFIDEVKLKEKQKLVKELKNETDEDRKKKIKYLIQRFDNQIREKTKAQKEKIEEMKETTVNEGNVPYYPKKSEKRLSKLLNQYGELKESKKLEKYIKKKTKKINRKDQAQLIS